ncbi:hypothetical protein [Burkholderia phage BCSR5]|nr:hypothetical protein [Burkholderia phage BCSR5]
MDNQEVFTYPLTTYAAVLGVAALAGIVRYINTKEPFKWSHLLRDCVTSGFNGLVMFWVCDYKEITGSLQMVFVAVAAMMGARAWAEIENYLRMRYGSGAVKQVDEQLDKVEQTTAEGTDQPPADSNEAQK